jgi:hypothetical protein
MVFIILPFTHLIANTWVSNFRMVVWADGEHYHLVLVKPQHFLAEWQ